MLLPNDTTFLTISTSSSQQLTDNSIRNISQVLLFLGGY